MHVINVQTESLFQALSDPIRIRIMRLLVSSGREACLCYLSESLLEPDYKLSRHVKVLRYAGLLSAEKEGRWVYHRVIKDSDHLKVLYRFILALPDADHAFANDLERLKARVFERVEKRCKTEPSPKSRKKLKAK